MFQFMYLAEEATAENTQMSKWDEIITFITNLLNNPFIKIFVATLVFLILWWITSGIVRKIKKQRMKKTKDKLLTSIICTIVLWSIRILLIISYAGTVGIDTAGLAALVASAGVAIGLALQGSLGNLAGGIILLITRPFKMGDYIGGADVEGTVEDIHLFYTHLVSVDNKVILVPNGTLANGTIINYSTKDIRRVEAKFSVSYEEDIKKVISEIEKVVSAHPLILKDPTFFVRESGHEESRVTITVRAWVKNGDYWTVYFDLIEQVRAMFRENNITIPYPQIDIHNK